MVRGIRRGVVAAMAGIVLCAVGVGGARASQAVDGSSLATAANSGMAPVSPAPGAQLWVARYNGPGGYDTARSVAVSPDRKTVFVTGYSLGAGSGYDYATAAYSMETGAHLWVKRYNGPGNNVDAATSLAVSPTGSTVFVTGHSAGIYATVAYSAAPGDHLWTKRYNGPGSGYDAATSVAVSPTGSTVFVTGKSTGVTSDYDYATVAYNAATGAQLWIKRYNGPGNSSDVAWSVAVSPTGGAVFVTGSSVGRNSDQDYATVAYNAATGAHLWTKRYNGPGNGNDFAHSVAVSPDGGTVFVTGGSPGTTSICDYATVAY